VDDLFVANFLDFASFDLIWTKDSLLEVAHTWKNVVWVSQIVLLMKSLGTFGSSNKTKSPQVIAGDIYYKHSQHQSLQVLIVTFLFTEESPSFYNLWDVWHNKVFYSMLWSNRISN